MSNEVSSTLTYGPWIAHVGNDNPLPPETICEAQTCDKDIINPQASKFWDWHINGESSDIAFYRVVTKTTQSTALELLDKAARHMEDRAATYDRTDGERSMEATVKAFNLITGLQLKESDGWLLLQILKDVRQWQRPDYHQDSAEDCIAYAALKAEALAKGN